ncbi:hypothetical protein ON010_g17951 [Phytophthora cinnamomi]|nr:hypothetical protein ON010_g17951 [Phytophthora cinnamomi]
MGHQRSCLHELYVKLRRPHGLPILWHSDVTRLAYSSFDSRRHGGQGHEREGPDGRRGVRAGVPAQAVQRERPGGDEATAAGPPGAGARRRAGAAAPRHDQGAHGVGAGTRQCHRTLLLLLLGN